MTKNKKEKIQAGDIVFHRTDLIGNWPMVVDDIPEYADPDNEEMTVSWMTKTGFLKYAKVNAKSVRHGKGL